MSRFDFGGSVSCDITADALHEAALKCNKVWGVAPDLAFILSKLEELYPERCIDNIDSELVAINIAAELARKGQRPYVVDKIPFLTMRAFEQIRNEISYQNLPVTIIGFGDGLIPTSGSIENCIEDISLMRTLINMSVVSVSDPNMIRSFIQQSLDLNNPLYIRQADGNSGRFIYNTEKTNYPIGKGLVARKGKDLTIITHGVLVASALEAAELVAEAEIDIRVIDMYSIKPLDTELIIKAIKETSSIIVVEDHLKRGGLSSAVAELIVDEGVFPEHIIRMGIPDVIPDIIALCDSDEMLRDKCSFGTKAIVRKIREFVWPRGSEWDWTHLDKHHDKHQCILHDT